MTLPLILQQAIDEEAALVKGKEIVKARKELTSSYRTENIRKPCIHNSLQRTAYLVSRMPATFAAIVFTFQKMIERSEALQIKSLLDLGAGPATSLWVALEFFLKLERATLIERDSEMIALGQRLLSKSSPSFPVTWRKADLEKPISFEPHDLVIASYSMGELDPKRAKELLLLAFQAANERLVIIEPGTPKGFRALLEIRSHLLEHKAFLQAPCPHLLTCPLKEGDWCHFSTRVSRSSLHRRMKEGSLGYEDEKFFYLIFSKKAHDLPEARILSPPLKRLKHLQFRLCTPTGIQEKIFSKKEGEIYKKMRHLRWGDSIEKIEI
jgi:ribosomal protein RSM22 (predicted rRNA methylase)